MKACPPLLVLEISTCSALGAAWCLSAALRVLVGACRGCPDKMRLLAMQTNIVLDVDVNVSRSLCEWCHAMLEVFVLPAWAWMLGHGRMTRAGHGDPKSFLRPTCGGSRGEIALHARHL